MSTTLRWGLIGASTIAREWMIDAIRADGRRRRLGDEQRPGSRRAPTRRRMASRTPRPASTSCSDEVDAVYISTTNELHHDQALARRHGRQARPVREAARADPRRCARDGRGLPRRPASCMATNHHLRNAGTHRAMREAIADGPHRQAARRPGLPCRLPAAASAGLAPHQARRRRRRGARHHGARRRHAALRAGRRSGRGHGADPVRRHGARRGRGRRHGRDPLQLRRARAVPRCLHHQLRQDRLRGARHRRLADRNAIA